jgi:hypothetical protein
MRSRNSSRIGGAFGEAMFNILEKCAIEAYHASRVGRLNWSLAFTFVVRLTEIK